MRGPLPRTGRLLPLFSLLAVLWIASPGPAPAMPTITQEPYKLETDGTRSDLSTDPADPTVFTWSEGELILWWAFSTSAENGIPASEWHVRVFPGGEVTDYPAGWCQDGATRFCANPEEELGAGEWEFWVTATDDEGTDTSETYYIRMTFPPIVETDYFPVAAEFRGKLARLERTAFDFGRIANGIVDTPEVNGCDNPSMFYGNGRLHFIFGDPNVYTEEGDNRGLRGALAFTDEIVPEKGIDISHHRNWVMDPETGTAASLIDRLPGTSRPNNTGGAIVPHGDGQRIWFAVYDYGSGPRPSYRNYYRVSIVYSDDYFATPAIRDEELILWDKDDPGNGPNNPDPYLGYHMRIFKDHLYMMIPREGGSDPVLLRCRLDELDNTTLANWHHLVSVDDSGVPTWSESGVTRGQISQADFPTVEFGGGDAGIVTSSTWNPYLNRWIAFPALGNKVWRARHLWGPYEALTLPRFFSFTHFAQSYALFAHEALLGDNGAWIYHVQARSWQPIGYYGTYNQRLQLRDKLKMTVSPKSGVAGDAITITCINDTELPAPAPENVSVTVDGRPATFVSQEGDNYTFTYELTGEENGGEVGLIDVAGVMDVPFTEGSAYRCSRDVAFVVNHRNELAVSITAPAPDSTVSGWTAIDLSVAYPAGPETLGPGDPEVRILKTELRHLGVAEEEVIDTDLNPPYTLYVDTRRFSDGPHTFRVIAYGSLDRRGIDEITLNVSNGPQPGVAGNLVTDGTMEAPDTAAWQPLYDATLSKITGADHRSGSRSLLVHSDVPGSWSGFRQTVTGLEGGERLRLMAWGRLKNNYTAALRWIVRDQSGGVLASEYASSYGYFRRLHHEFDNPAGNTELMLDLLITDTGSTGVIAGTDVVDVEAVIDDLVLRPACHPLVEGPTGVAWEAAPSGDAVTVTWTPSDDVNVEFYGILRRVAGSGPDDWEKIGEVHAYDSAYVDADLPGAPGEFEYDVVSIDFMGWTSADLPPLGEISDVLSGEPPLLVNKQDDTLVVEQDPGVTAYNVHADALGSWYSPSEEEGSICGVTEWTDNSDGTVTLSYEVPENSWIVVTGSDACRESSAGSASDGTARDASPDWPTCGPMP